MKGVLTPNNNIMIYPVSPVGNVSAAVEVKGGE